MVRCVSNKNGLDFRGDPAHGMTELGLGLGLGLQLPWWRVAFSEWFTVGDICWLSADQTRLALDAVHNV